MPLDYQLVEVGGLGLVHRFGAKSSMMSSSMRVRRISISTLLSSLAAFSWRNSWSARVNSTVAAATDRDVPERRGQVRLPDAHGSQDESAAGIVEEPQRAQLVPELPVEQAPVSLEKVSMRMPASSFAAQARSAAEERSRRSTSSRAAG